MARTGYRGNVSSSIIANPVKSCRAPPPPPITFSLAPYPVALRQVRPRRLWLIPCQSMPCTLPAPPSSWHLYRPGKYGPDGCVLHFFGVRLPNTPPASTAAPGPADGVSASSATNGSTPAANATATTTTTATTEVKRANWGFLTVINDEQGRLSGGLSLFTKDQDLLKTPEVRGGGCRAD